MELAGADAAPPDHSGHLLIAEGGRGLEVISIGGNSGVAVHEIHPLGWGIAAEQRAAAVMLQRSPAHVGDAFAAVAGQACHPSAQEPEAWIAAFIALLEQQLQAEADAEQGRSSWPQRSRWGTSPVALRLAMAGSKAPTPGRISASTPSRSSALWINEQP